MSSLQILLLLTTFDLNSCSQSYLYIDSHENSDNVDNALNTPNKSTEFVTYLGIFNNTQQCVEQCLNQSISDDYRCESYTYYTSSFNSPDSFKSHCYGRFGSQYGLIWTPITKKNVNSGRIIYKCKSNLDCALNGICDQTTGNCTCNTGWNGYHCQQLNLLPATKGNGYHIINDNNSGLPTSSWGGAVLVDTSDNANESTKYHMYLAEFDNHCGVNSWTLNSVVTHAQSTNGYNSPYKRVSVIHSHFAHEPDAIFGPNGEIVLYYAAYNFSGVIECECSDGSTPPSCKPPPRKFINIMQYANDFDGQWYRTVIFPNRSVNETDTNLSGVILKNGSFIGLERTRTNVTTGHRSLYLVTSVNWKNGSEYMQHKQILFPQLVGGLTEDPFVWRDCNGYFHAMFHNQSPLDITSICGAHAYSMNGVDWIYGAVSYNGTVEFTDNTKFSFLRRERPHFIFDDDLCTPIALTNGAEYGGKYGDGTYTLLQPIKH